MDEETTKKARQDLDEAIQTYLEALGTREGFLVDWVLITAQHLPEDDGSSTKSNIFVSTDQPFYRGLGLIHYAKVIMEDQFR